MRLKMKYVIAVLALLTSLGLGFGSALAEERVTLLTDPNSMYVDLAEGSGTIYKSLMVTNVSDVERLVTVSWDYYTGPVGEEILAPESWFTFPDGPLTVYPGLFKAFNIEVKVPGGTEELKYKAYFRVFDGTNYARHITVQVRVGKAVPTYEYSITQGLYDAVLDQPGIGRCVVPNFGVRNTGTTACEFSVFSKLPSGDSDPEYQTAPYEGEGDSITYNWLTIDADPSQDGRQDTILINSYETGWPVLVIQVPSDVPNGKYKMWVGVRIAEDTGSFIGIGYASKIRLVVNRGLVAESKDESFIQKYLLYILGGLVGLVLLVIVVLLVKGKQTSKVPGYSQYRR